MTMVNLSSSSKKIPLFWWSEPRLMGKKKENYGDLLSRYLVERISGKKVEWVQPKKQPWYRLNKTNYLAAGSIIHHATRDSTVWGSGIIDRKQQIAPADFRAVRGPRTRQYLLELGYDCPEVYGDPALLMPEFYNPKIEKKYKIGIIPHYHDFKEVFEVYQNDPEVKVIDMMTLDVEAVTREILECEQTISSSLHGLIVSHAYDIPSIWVEFSDKLFGDGVKFADYLESVSLTVYKPKFLDHQYSSEGFIKLIKEFPASPQPENLKVLRVNLLNSCPF